MGLYLLDYGAGNVRSLANSLKKLGYDFQWIASSDDFEKATVRAHIFSPLREHMTLSDSLSLLSRDLFSLALARSRVPSNTSSPAIYWNL